MTGCAASAIATHTPNPTGAPGSAPCQPAPVPRANAITTTPPSASSLAAVTTFCTHRPDATPTRLMPVNSATSPAPSGAMSAGGQASRRTRNSPAATPIAAIATPLVPRASTQPTTKPARVPNASRTKAYLPAARGWRVVSSAKQSAPRNASAAPNTHTTKVSPGRPSRAATMPGVRKIPAPTVMPTTMASPSTRRSERLRSVICNRSSAIGPVHGRGMCTEKRRGAACCAPTVRPAPTFTERMLSLRPAARPSAAVAVVPAPAPAPISPAAGSRPAAAVPTTWRTRSTPAATTTTTTAAAAPLRSGPPAVTIAAPAPAPPATRAPPIGLARRGLRAVWTVAAIAHPTTVSRERHSITAVTLHRVALPHGRRVGAPPGEQRAFGGAEPRAYPSCCSVGAELVLEVHLHARPRTHAVDEQVARTAGERVPTAVVRPIPIPVEPVAVKAVAVGPGEDRIVAQERIVKERIVARAVQRRVAVAVRPAPAVAEVHRVVGIV